MRFNKAIIRLSAISIFFVTTMLGSFILTSSPAQAACAPLDTTNGTVTQTVNIPAAGTYTIWSRIMAPDATSNSYYLEIDDTTCGVNIGDSAITANTWAWVDYKNGSTNTKVTATLTVGNHTVRMVGKEAGVKLDRVLFLQDTCVPTGTGDNCTNIAINTPPTASVTAPANNATFNAPADITINATAGDTDGTVSKVEFFQGATKLGEDLASPYAYSWTGVAAGSYALTAKATDNSGATTTSSAVNVTVSTNPPSGNCSATAPCSIWTNGDTPVTIDQPDTQAVELGMKFRSDVAGSISGVRFYKSNANTGTHVASLWTSTGTRLSNATFTGETASGWQQVSFASPVSIAANTTYIVSYHAPVGHYSADNNYFLAGRDKPPLHALGSGVDGPNGVYKYGAAGNFPTDTYQSNNYWVDPVFINTTTPPPDTTPPTASLTNPVNGATVSGIVNVTSTTSDNVAVTKVEYYIDGVLKATSSSFNWDTKTVQNGNHAVMVKAYDAASNSASDSVSVTVQNGDTIPPSAPTNLTASAAAYNRVNLSWAASTDNVGVTGYWIVRGGVTIAQAGATTSYVDNSVTASTSYSYQLIAYDGSGNNSAPSNAAAVTTPAAPDTQAPTAPSSLQATVPNSSQINLTWTASTDNIGVTGYDVYRNTAKVATVTSTSFGDAGLSASTTYNYYVIARDAAGNSSPASATVNATTPAAVTQGSITGKVTGSGAPLSGAAVTITVSGVLKTYKTNSLGNYTVPNLPAGTYSVKYSKNKYLPQTINVVVSAGTTTVQNVTLIKR